MANVCERCWRPISGEGVVSPHTAQLLLETFSSPVMLRFSPDHMDLELVVKLISKELEAPQCGQPALLERAGEILFVGLVRHLAHISRHRRACSMDFPTLESPGGFVAMHQSPEAKWRLTDLASNAGMSRTAIAVGFRLVAKKTPRAYLAQSRLSIARRAVAEGRGLKRAAAVSGYASKAPLSRALARTPLRWREFAVLSAVPTAPSLSLPPRSLLLPPALTHSERREGLRD